jgi:cell division protein FtsZ
MNPKETGMIQFSSDHAHPLPRSGDSAGCAVIGVGRAGVHIIDQLILERCGPRHLVAVDTDEQDIRASVAPHKHLLGRSRLRGLGTGGDPTLAAALAGEDAPALAELTAGVRTAVIVAGLGGGTGTGAAPVIAARLRATGVRVFAVVCTPFDFEGARVLRAAEGLDVLETACDGVAALASQRLIHVPEAREDIREVFRHVNALAARGAAALLDLLHADGTAPLSAAELRRLLGAPGLENVWAAHGAARGPDRIERVAGQIAASPFFEDGTAWKQAQAAVLSVVGGADMPVAEMRELVARLREVMPIALDIRGSAWIDPRAEGILRATLLLTAADASPAPGIAPVAAPAGAAAPAQRREEPAPAPSAPAVGELPGQDSLPLDAAPPRPSRKKAPTPQRYFVRQEELQLDQKTNRGRFEKTTPTVIDGQDLDIPTFLRHGIKLKL